MEDEKIKEEIKKKKQMNLKSNNIRLGVKKWGEEWNMRRQLCKRKQKKRNKRRNDLWKKGKKVRKKGWRKERMNWKNKTKKGNKIQGRCLPENNKNY